MSFRGNYGNTRGNRTKQTKGGFRGGNRSSKYQGSNSEKRPWRGNANWNDRNWSRRSRGNFHHRPNSRTENPTYRSYNYDKTFNNDYYGQGESSKEPEGEGPPLPGSEAERSNKIELDKKRIREALSSATELNQPLNFKNSNIENISKENSLNKKKTTTLSELRLTANDLMEIGSVAGKSIDNNDLEDSGEVLQTTVKNTHFNTQFNNHPCENIDQQNYKSFSKPQSGGWKTFQIPTNESNSQSNHVLTNFSKQSHNEREERILGDIIVPEGSRFSEPRVVNPNVSDRIGRLYKSFLKTRYFGNKFRFSNSDSPLKQKHQNPLLDTASTKSKNVPDKSKSQEKTAKKPVSDEEEPVMPLPIQIKMELMESNEKDLELESREELEADEFLKEFSHLLNSDFTIPLETLEQLGLSYILDLPLTEIEQNDMTKSNTSFHSTSESVENKSDKLLRVKSLSTLNSTPFTDNVGTSHEKLVRDEIISNQPPRTNEKTASFVESLPTLRHNLSPLNLSSSQRTSPGLFSNQSLHISGENEGLNRSANILSEPSGLNVEHLVNEVVAKISSTAKMASQNRINDRSLNQNESSLTDLDIIVKKFKESVDSVFRNKVAENRDESITIQNDYCIRNQMFLPSQTNSTSSIPRRDEQIGECLQNCQSKNHLIDISDKILRMFLIDKQIQTLMEEKIKIYNELMSTKEVASAFFNSWVKDKQGSGIKRSTDESNMVNTSQKVHDASQSHISSKLENSINSVKVQEKSNVNNKLATSVDQIGLSDLLHSMEAVKEYLISFPTNTVSNAMTACKESLIEIKKEAMVRGENEETSDETSFSNTNINNDSEEPKKRKKKTAEKIKPKKKKRVDAETFNEDNQQNSVNSCSTKAQTSTICDDIIEINSDDEKSEVLCETKFYPLIDNIKEESNSNEIKKSKAEKDVLKFNHKEVTVLCMKILEVKKLCVTGCTDGQILIYSLSSGRLKGRIKSHQESITCLCELNGLVISGSTDNTLRCFHIQTRTELYNVTIGYQVQCMDLHNGFLYVGTKVGLLFTYTIKEELNLTDEPLNVSNNSILAVRAAKEGVRNILIVAVRNEPISVRDATTGLLIRTFNWCDIVYCLEFTGESPIVYCGTRTKSVVAVDFINGEEKFKCDAGRGVSHICFAHDLMFTACYDGEVYVYDYKKKSLVTSISVSKGMLLNLKVYRNQIIVATTRSELLVIPFPQELKKYLNLMEKT